MILGFEKNHSVKISTSIVGHDGGKRQIAGELQIFDLDHIQTEQASNKLAVYYMLLTS